MAVAEDLGHGGRHVGGTQVTLLTVLRMAIGWHFLYEGLVKVFDPEWTSAGFLAASSGPFAGVFHRVAESPAALRAVDVLNEWGLVLVGVGLLLGLLTRCAAAGGVLLLALYYLAAPPIADAGRGEGSYLIVDKNLVELLALVVVVALPAAREIGFDAWIRRWRRPSPSAPVLEGELIRPASPAPGSLAVFAGRRDLLKSLVSLPFLGAFAVAFLRRHAPRSQEEQALVSAVTGPVDAVTSATIKTFTFQGLEDLRGQVPHSRIGDLELSRVILGGNLIGGWAHARDLIYVSKLVKAYHREEKVFQTLALAERCGVNTILTNPILSSVIRKYWDRGFGKIQFISDCALRGDLFEGIRMSIDNGAHACYVQGAMADRIVADGRIRDIARALEIIRAAGLPAGIGAHELRTVQACVESGLKPDFWMKTLHTTDYWSATRAEEHNNIWCTEPDETVKFMHGVEEPWIAFKVLAAGALEPARAFRHAFESGADFICVGMYDFQIVEDINLALDVLGGPLERARSWRSA